MSLGHAEHVNFSPDNILEVTKVACKTTGSSAAKRLASGTKIVKCRLAFAPGSCIGSCWLLFFELSVARAASAQSPFFQFCAESDLNMAM